MAKDYHVLVLAMSTLASVSPNNYWFGKKEGNGSNYIGQLEPIPLYLQKDLGIKISHIIIMETAEVVAPQQLGNGDDQRSSQETCALIRDYWGRHIDWDGVGDTISASEFFVRRLAKEGLSPEYVCPQKYLNDYTWPEGLEPSDYKGIPLDPDDLPTGLETLQRVIRELYRQYLLENKDDEKLEHWKLWIDTHGAFREFSLAMFGLMQMLAAPDEQKLWELEPDETTREVLVKRFNDKLDTIPITDVYTVNFNPVSREGIIVKQTKFFKTFIDPAITEYLNYGQYVQMTLRSDAMLSDTEYRKDYAFISYRRSDSSKERFAFLGTMRKYGFHYWYDDAIEPMEKWDERLEAANKNCAVFIGLITRNYYDSYQCVKELKQAIKEDKPIYLVSLDRTPLYAPDEKKYPDGKVCVKDEYTKHTIEINLDELRGIATSQQLPLDILIINGVFQYSELKNRLIKVYKKALGDDYTVDN